MKLKFICTSGKCRGKDSPGPVIELPVEMVMDDRNLATLFCPKCKQRLVPSK